MNEGLPYIDIIERLIFQVQMGARKLVHEDKQVKITVYTVNSSPVYSYPSVRVDIQNLARSDFN